MRMAESLLMFEYAGQVVELTKDTLRVKIRPEAIERLKYLTKNDDILRTSLESLIRWSHYPIIGITSITEVWSEIVAMPPGSKEIKKVVLNTQYPGGFRIYEILLHSEDADMLMAEVRKLLAPRF